MRLGARVTAVEETVSHHGLLLKLLLCGTWPHTCPPHQVSRVHHVTTRTPHAPGSPLGHPRHNMSTHPAMGRVARQLLLCHHVLQVSNVRVGGRGIAVRTRSRELFQELWRKRARALGAWLALVRIRVAPGHALCLGEILQGGGGLVGWDDTRQVELRDARVARSNDVTQVGAVGAQKGVRGVGAALVGVGHAFTEHVLQLLRRDNIFWVLLGELRGYTAQRGVHRASVRGVLHAREPSHLVLGVHRGQAVSHPVQGSPSGAHHGRIHTVKAHGVGGQLAAVGPNGTLGQQHRALVVPWVTSDDVDSGHQRPIWHHLVIRGGNGLDRVVVEWGGARHGILGHL